MDNPGLAVGFCESPDCNRIDLSCVCSETLVKFLFCALILCELLFTDVACAFLYYDSYDECVLVLDVFLAL